MYRACKLAIVFFSGAMNTFAFSASLDFSTETKRITQTVSCETSNIQPGDGTFPTLFSCILGSAETAKIFVNQRDKSKEVRNIKLIWNDWTKDGGYGKHADKIEAQRLVRSFAKLYAPKLEGALEKAFFAKKNRSFSTDTYSIVYTYHRGPSMDERMLVLTSK